MGVLQGWTGEIDRPSIDFGWRLERSSDSYVAVVAWMTASVARSVDKFVDHVLRPDKTGTLQG